jgi:hypothetical protein
VPDENGEYAFLPNERIISCFILKAPDEPGRDTLARLSRDATGDNVPQRVVVSSARDGNGGMEGVFLTELEPEATAVDHESVDGSSGFPPKVLACVTSVAEQLTKVDLAAMQRAIEQAAVGKQLWPEDVGRFTTEEMEFALYALDQALLRPYSLAYYYTSKADAQAICEPGGGIKASAERGTVVLCTKSPIALGWEQHGRGSFRSNVGQLLWQARPTDVYAGGQYANRLEVLVLVAVPTAVLEDRSNHLKGSALCTIPSTLLTEAGGLLNAHIQKVYELGAAPPASAIEPATLPSNEIASSRGGTPPRSRKPPPPQLPVAQAGATVSTHEEPPGLQPMPVPGAVDQDAASAATGGMSNPLFNPPSGGNSGNAALNLPTIEAIFSEIDTDQSGQLETDEFTSWWRANGGDPSQIPLFEECFELVGAEDGVPGVSLLEFQKVIGAVAANDWLEKFSREHQRPYWWNQKTGESTWVDPGGPDRVNECVQEWLEHVGVMRIEV